jgi:predicted ATP-grasp superfamily ATP-dependent carboligase
MPHATDLIIVGASARAAAFSALRAGMRPWCADLFADADLRACCPAVRLTGRYPHALAELLAAAPPAPWIYTGGLENHPRLVSRLAKTRPLWGNDATALRAVRDPMYTASLLGDAGLPKPRVLLLGWRAGDDSPPCSPRGTIVPRSPTYRPDAHWLVKPRRGSGGSGIRFYRGEAEGMSPTRAYLQEYVEGEPRAALYLAGPWGTRLVGVTRQLVGEPWLHAQPFHYCGSVGLLPLSANDRAALERLGGELASGCKLRGLFGVDGIWRDATFWPVEVNPRYTASVEVLEHATGFRALAWHRLAFDGEAPIPSRPAAVRGGVIGKAILFAWNDLTFPADGPWLGSLAARKYEDMPAYADIPTAGEQISARHPVLTVFARAADVSSCLIALRRRAADVAAWLGMASEPEA